VDNELYFLGATIAEKKEHKEDWTYPGKIYSAKCPNNFNEPFKLDIIVEGLTRNHGYCRSRTHNGGYFSSDNGIIKVTAPSYINDQWLVEKIQEGQFSEIAFSDINNDGIDEMLTIEPFHGNSIKLYQKKNEMYHEIYHYPLEIDFAHTLVGTKIFNKNCFIGGIRRINPDLFLIEYDNNQVQLTIIDEGVGPANCGLYSNNSITLIHSANHTQNHAAVYILKK
jgi:hypothetical protein